MSFNDHFSGHSAQYCAFRPRYPDSLFLWLSSLCGAHSLAWDCATGSGQAATSLTRYFDKVIATDASSNQISNAEATPGVVYRVATAEDSGIEADSVDLITVAQALHWFDIPAFALEAARVLKADGVLAVWTYGLMEFGGGLNEVIAHLYGDIVGKYWPFERKMVESGYESVEMPFEEIPTETFEMSENWSFSNLIGYLNTWSAVKAYEKDQGSNPLDAIHHDLLKQWGDIGEQRIATWPLATKVWRKPHNQSNKAQPVAAGTH
jgi:ubiquinone/menaquinone biosynthesis C-methylase UbiE